MTRIATIRSTVDRPDLVTRALSPDNTEEMDTTIEDDTLVTTIERETTSGLRSTVDDYVVNLSVALDVIQIANRHETINEQTKL